MRQAFLNGDTVKMGSEENLIHISGPYKVF